MFIHDAPARPRHVLVAEDDPDLLDLIARAFEAFGAKVDRASDGTSALRLLGAFVPDLVISDVRMPGATGIDLLRAARAEWRHLPFVLMTGFGDVKASEVTSLEHAVVLPKPLGLDVLFKAVDELLSSSPARKETLL